MSPWGRLYFERRPSLYYFSSGGLILQRRHYCYFCYVSSGERSNSPFHSELLHSNTTPPSHSKALSYGTVAPLPPPTLSYDTVAPLPPPTLSDDFDSTTVATLLPPTQRFDPRVKVHDEECLSSKIAGEEGEGALPNLAPVGTGTEQLIQSAQEVDNEQAVTGAPKFDKIGEKQVTNEMEGNMKNQAGNIQEKGSSIAVCEAPSIVEQVDGVEQVNSSIPLVGSSKKKGLGERISVHSRVSNVSYSFYKSLSSWIEKVKQHLSYNEGKLLVLEEARKEAVGFFQKTIEEMGWEEYEKRSEETKGEKEGVISGENGEEGECEGEEEECENEGYLESSNAWIDELEELTGVKWVNGVLMEIKSYMDVVYDNEQWIHVEDIDAMALKACIILMEMDKADPSGGCLGPDTKLGCQLRANQERLGGKLCRWAWRAYGPGYDE
nr:hypothetical protein Iba_chr05dCG12320 [Ipomoea batatas]